MILVVEADQAGSACTPEQMMAHLLEEWTHLWTHPGERSTLGREVSQEAKGRWRAKKEMTFQQGR